MELGKVFGRINDVKVKQVWMRNTFAGIDKHGDSYSLIVTTRIMINFHQACCPFLGNDDSPVVKKSNTYETKLCTFCTMVMTVVLICRKLVK